jgi:hypothetical protein
MEGLHFEGLRSDPTAVFRFVWENRDPLGIDPGAFTRVTSVRPVMRVSNDHRYLRETVAEYVQTLQVYSNELERGLGIRKPKGLGNQLITLQGGGTLIFDEFGRLKFHIGTGVRSTRRQSARLKGLFERGMLTPTPDSAGRIAQMHRHRLLRPGPVPPGEN